MIRLQLSRDVSEGTAGCLALVRRTHAQCGLGLLLHGKILAVVPQMNLVLELKFLGIAQGFFLQLVHASRWWLEREVKRQTSYQQVAGSCLKVQT